jgi:actin-related protein
LTVKYDYYSRPLPDEEQYQISNPVDQDASGLWYGESELWYQLMETYLEHGYHSALNSQLHHHPLLLVEKSYTPPPLRQAVLELVMEGLQVPAVFMGRDATLACYACGRTTGTVVDMGYSGTTVTPVHDGYVETKGMRRLPVGTKHQDEFIANTVLDGLVTTKSDQKQFQPLYQVRTKMRRPLDILHESCRLAVAQQCREEGSGAAVLAVNDNSGFTAPSKAFELPDGTTVHIPAKQRFAAAHLVLGSTSGIKGEAASDEEDDKFRQRILAETKALLATRISQAEAVFDNGGDSKEEDKETKEYFEQVYSEGASVGLLKRRSSAPSADGEAGKQQMPFSTTWKHLQKACAPFLTQIQQEYLTSAAIPTMVVDSSFQCDRDQQPQLLANVVLTGGGACLGPTDQALPEWLRQRVEALIHPHTPGWRVKVTTPNMAERSVGSWLGGSILGSLGTFHDMWITKKEYDEWGSAIVNRKCP